MFYYLWIEVEGADSETVVIRYLRVRFTLFVCVLVVLTFV